MELHFSRAFRRGSWFQPLGCFVNGRGALIDHGFANHADLQFARCDMLRGNQPFQPIEDVLFKHPPEFMRRSGQKNNNCVAILIVNVQKLAGR